MRYARREHAPRRAESGLQPVSGSRMRRPARCGGRLRPQQGPKRLMERSRGREVTGGRERRQHPGQSLYRAGAWVSPTRVSTRPTVPDPVPYPIVVG